MRKKGFIFLLTTFNLLVLTASLSNEKAPSEFDVQTILEKVRKAQRPAENMQIEWICERGPGMSWGGRPVSPEKQISLTRYKGSAVLGGTCLRIEERQETYYGKDVNEAGTISEHTYVFDGIEQRKLTKRTKGLGNSGSRGVIWLTDLYPLLRMRLFFSSSLQDKELEARYEWKLTDTNTADVYVLEAVAPNTLPYQLTVDGNRGFNIVKVRRVREDGSVDYEEKFKVKQYPGGMWFISERERIRFGRGDKPESTVEEKLTVTRVEFDTPKPDKEVFKLQFPTGATVADMTFNYNHHTDFLVGCLSERKHTKEDPAVGAVLGERAGEEKPAGSAEVFGQAKEVIINSIEQRKDCFVDLDTGKLLSVPEDFHLNRQPKEWLEKNGVDARVETDKGLCGLWTFNTVVIPVDSKRWDSITPSQCHEVLEKTDGIYPPIMSGEGNLPAAFVFQTWDSRGVLQILEVNRDTQPHSIKVRYKIVQNSLPARKGQEREQ